MRIALDLTAIVPGRSGGLETYAMGLTRALADAATDDELLLLCRPAFGRALPPLPERVRPVFAPDALPATVARLAWVPAAARRERVDVVHFVANFGAAPDRWRAVVTVHDLIPHHYLRHGWRALDVRTRVHLALLVGGARVADHVIAVSRATAADLGDVAGVAPSRISAIPIAGRVAPAVVAGERDGAFVTVGSGSPHKNLLRLLAGYRLSGVRRPLVVAGVDGWLCDAQALAREAAEPCRGRVIVAGAVDDARLFALYDGARALFAPSLVEGFGLPPLEAASRGVPLALSTIAAHRELWPDAACWFDPLDVASIATAFVRLDGDGELCRDLGARARRRAAAFSWSDTARQTLAVYHQTVT